MVDGSRYKVTLEHRYANIDVAVQNVLWFAQEGPNAAGPPELLLGNRLRTFLLSTDYPHLISGFQSDQFQYLNVRVQQVFPDSTTAYVVPIGTTGTASSVNGNTLPSGCSLVVRLRAVRNNAQGRGRLYLGGFALVVADLPPIITVRDGGYWAQRLVDRAAAWCAGIQFAAAPIITGEPVFRWGVWSKLAAGPRPPYADGFSPMASFDAASAIRYQRRREVGVGI